MDIQALIKELDHQVDELLKNQVKHPTIKGDETISRLLARIATLQINESRRSKR